MHKTPGRHAHHRPAAASLPPEFSEEQLIAFDRAYAVAKDTGALDRHQVAAAVDRELSQNRAARLA